MQKVISDLNRLLERKDCRKIVVSEYFAEFVKIYYCEWDFRLSIESGKRIDKFVDMIVKIFMNEHTTEIYITIPDGSERKTVAHYPNYRLTNELETLFIGQWPEQLTE